MFEGDREFFSGVLGGAAIEMLKWYKLRHTLHKGLPDWSKSWLYWILTILMAVFGGALVSLYVASGANVSLILALNIGATAPLMLAAISQGVPKIAPGRVN